MRIFIIHNLLYYIVVHYITLHVFVQKGAKNIDADIYNMSFFENMYEIYIITFIFCEYMVK